MSVAQASRPNAPTSTDKGLVQEVTILNKLGIHARPSASFVKLASKFACDVFIERDGESINGKSIMGLLMLAAGPGSRMRIRCIGTDAREALEALTALILNKFGEE